MQFTIKDISLWFHDQKKCWVLQVGGGVRRGFQQFTHLNGCRSRKPSVDTQTEFIRHVNQQLTNS